MNKIINSLKVILSGSFLLYMTSLQASADWLPLPVEDTEGTVLTITHEVPGGPGYHGHTTIYAIVYNCPYYEFDVFDYNDRETLKQQEWQAGDRIYLKFLRKEFGFFMGGYMCFYEIYNFNRDATVFAMAYYVGSWE